MTRRIIICVLIFTCCFQFLAKADEGMWLPLLIKRLNYTDMQKMGLKLTAEEIYDINKSSLKDGVVNFGNFCSGEIISSQGLVLTNHHCGYEAIQSHSSVQNNILANGFWAKSKDQELPNRDLSVTFLVRMEDVTAKINSALPPTLPFDEREDKIKEISEKLEKEAVAGTHYTAEVKSFFEGNEFYLFVFETYTDVRLVGAPPSSIGKFGGETDNWMWPRHTGDFSMFRIYTGPDGKPADYSPNNIPLKPKFFFPISLKGANLNDFSMVMGYPGGTERYMTSNGVKMVYEQTNPITIRLREKRLELMKKDMDADPEVKIKYAAKYSQIINYYKNFIGENEGIRRNNVIAKKQAQEAEFQQWVNADPARKTAYGNLLAENADIYEKYRKVNPLERYLEEGIFGSEILTFTYQFVNSTNDQNAGKLINLIDDHFKNYNPSTDKKITAALFQMYYKDIDKRLHPSLFRQIEKKYKGDFDKYANDLISKSIFGDRERLITFLKNAAKETPSKGASKADKILEKDPAFSAMNSIISDFRSLIGPELGDVMERLEKNDHTYVKAVMEMKKDAKLYPDANFTMRLTYGSVLDYDPKDAVHYNYFTTLHGIMEKADSTNEEFIVPEKLKQLYKTKDYGRYADKDGTLRVCFISNNDITGGNSGSPVINGEGQLIGIAFDGNWEAISGDIAFEPKLQRTISTDIRYVLFIIDKYAGATNLIQEMTLVENK